jgi:uncharacterized protein
MADTARAHEAPRREDARGEEATFFGFCEAGEVRIQRCPACARHLYPPRGACPDCGSVVLTWVPISGGGTLYSFTVHHRGGPGFRDAAPYVIGIVELDEGVRMLGRVLADVDAVHIDGRVTVEVAELLDGWPVPVFVPRAS